MTDYGAATTADEVLDGVDLSGRRIVITGAASGLGEESTRALAAKGAHITMLARNDPKNAEAAERVRAAVPDADLTLGTLDLASFDSIRRFADSFLASTDAIDVLINNAGVMACPWGTTEDGFETQFGTNHLGHFLLTSRLMPALANGNAPRVVTLSSAAHTICDVDLDDYNFDRTEYQAWDAYGRSKSANAHFARELAARHGAGLLSFSVHPGAIMTNLSRHLDESLLNQAMERTKARNAEHGIEGGMVFKTTEAGAATQVWAATADDLSEHNGAYLADCQVGVKGGNATGHGFDPHIVDDATASRLWDLSEELVGESFAGPG